MSFLDKAKEKATQLATQAKEKVDDIQDKRKADDLLDDIGRIIYRQRTTGTVDPTDEAKIDELVDALKALEAAGTPILEAPAAPAASTLPPPAAPGGAPAPFPEPGN
jgi:predicted membrane chloride channel (bestrophin family)